MNDHTVIFTVYKGLTKLSDASFQSFVWLCQWLVHRIISNFIASFILNMCFCAPSSSWLSYSFCSPWFMESLVRLVRVWSMHSLIHSYQRVQQPPQQIWWSALHWRAQTKSWLPWQLHRLLRLALQMIAPFLSLSVKMHEWFEHWMLWCPDVHHSSPNVSLQILSIQTPLVISIWYKGFLPCYRSNFKPQ